MNKSLRLFFAVNLSDEIKKEIAETILPLIPADKWRKTLPENLHMTMHFLGHLPVDAVNKMEGETKPLQAFEPFEAEINCVGHFKGRVLWLGIGKGTEDFDLLNRKLQQAIGTQDDRFHAHITLARNKGAGKNETDALVERMRGIGFSKKVRIESMDLMGSELHKAGPKYSKVFSVKFTGLSQQPFSEDLQD